MAGVSPPAEPPSPDRASPDPTSGAPADLPADLAEFAFRYNNRSGLGVTDGERTAIALKGIEGKRLTYRPTN